MWARRASVQHCDVCGVGSPPEGAFHRDGESTLPRCRACEMRRGRGSTRGQSGTGCCCGASSSWPPCGGRGWRVCRDVRIDAFVVVSGAKTVRDAEERLTLPAPVISACYRHSMRNRRCEGLIRRGAARSNWTRPSQAQNGTVYWGKNPFWEMCELNLPAAKS